MTRSTGRLAIRLAARAAGAALASWLAAFGVGWQPATVAVAVGALTWLVLGCRHDLAR